jgi:ketosteroid isomerase-like protein
MSTEQIAKRLVELCRQGSYEEAQRELYADDARSIEPEGLPPGAFTDVHGLPAIIAKGEQFRTQVEAFHGTAVSDPVIAGNWFSVSMSLDVTLKGMGRIHMQEICVYHVRDGKIIREQFFYDAG